VVTVWRDYDHMNGFGAGQWIAMSILMVLLMGLLVALVVWLVRTTSAPSQGGPPSPTSSAEQLLAERFARGEIDEEEFTRRRALLRAGP
jgi:putative membrane protein